MMNRRIFILSFALVLGSTVWAERTPEQTRDVTRAVVANLDGDLPELMALYRDLHQHPELSLEEVQTAGKLAQIMKELGFEVTEKVGGTGVVAVMKNGSGPTVLVRTDTDALPVREETGLDYASKVEVRRPDGTIAPVMHACGHDMHMTCWVGTARVLARAKDRWSGTLVFIAQPAEEIGAGAKAMLADGLFERFPKPDVGFALHCDMVVAYGDVGYVVGYALANVDTIDITIVGKGGHGAHPQGTIDPIVLAARLILDLQTIVSREVDPLDAAVVTVGSIHAGTKHNIIPPDAKLQLTVRSFKDSTRKLLLDSITRKTKACALSAGAPEPVITIDSNFTPATFNDPELTRATLAALKAVLGGDHLKELAPVMGGEDFSRYSLAGVPCVMLRLGTLAPDDVRAAEAGQKQLPSLHSGFYHPIPGPSITTGVTAMTASVLRVLGK
jgi:hippurate hydrolase